jgi:arylsulfatase A
LYFYQPEDKRYAEDSFSFYNVLMGDMTNLTRDNVVYIASSGKLAIKKGDWRFIDCLGSGGFTEPSIVKSLPNCPQGQLYNLKDDPMETTNLYFERKYKVKELSELLQQLKDQGYNQH